MSGRIRLTRAEERYLEDLKGLQKSVRSRILGWVFELVPSIGLFAFGLHSEKRLFMLLGFLSLLFFAIWRMYGQYRGFRMMSRIYEARLSDPEDPNG